MHFSVVTVAALGLVSSTLTVTPFTKEAPKEARATTWETFISQCMNVFRLNFFMDRLTPSSITGSFDAAYFRNLTQQINCITSKGVHAMVQPAQLRRWHEAFITVTASFKTWWKK
ncbi:hypothetical protein GQ43DRAFT_471635 [Delitschia confertaspora ATCC 74209]|uniref:Glycoside hydrolase family 5 domain-containing protein n=1 Tax=Delitschia confertaspora ATCC 74209 TaxID=1513339 RepID=A0A9P4MW06_9PLEO|nr:hypothetical protein GQ43DRAFT_471635 [Delitschia confertaspora ATCC 74209]